MTHGKGRDFKKLPALNPEIVQDGQYVLSTASLTYSNTMQPSIASF